MDSFGIVLGGGGAKGSYEIGVWKALKELKIPIAAIAGTSVGALNGAIMVQDDYDIAFDLWSNIDIQHIIDLGSASYTDGNILSPREIALTIKTILGGGGLDVTPLKKLLQKYLDEDRIRNSPIDFGLVSFCLSSLKPLIAFKNDIPKGELIDYLLASSCLPIFKPLEIGKSKYIDGGIYDNIPISIIADKGIKNIIAVDVSGIGRVRKVSDNELNIIYIKNSEFLGKTLQFDGKSSIKNINLGYLDTMKVFKRYTGKRFYIENNSSLNKLLYPLNEDELDFLDITLDLKKAAFSANKLMNFNIIRSLYKYVSGKLNNNNAILAAAEITAEVYGVDRLKTYEWDELANEILKKHSEIKSSALFKNSLTSLKKVLANRNKSDFDMLDGSFLASYITAVDESESSLNSLQKFLAVFFPKLCIANLFLSMLIKRASR